MTYAITGGCGFLGKHLGRLLLSQGHDIINIDNLDPLCGGDPNVSHAHMDVENYDGMEDILLKSGAEVILHLAAYGRNLSCQHFPLSAWEANVNGTLNVLEFARNYPNRIKRVVCVSSNITLSDKLTVYKTTKETVEALVRLYTMMGVSCMGVRPSNIYGEGQSKTEYQPCAFAGMDKGFAEFGCFKITGDGTQARDWVHVKDVARGITLAANQSIVGTTVDICTGKLTSMNEVAELLGVPIDYVQARSGDAQVIISDPQPARDLIGFEAQISLADGIWDAFPEVKKGEF